MISKQAVEEQLERIGCNFRFWGRSEVNELGRILMDDEIIAECVNGEYGNGFAMLVSTNHRLLLVDKKPFLYLTVEDYRYEMITEFNYNHRMLNATINIYTANKTMTFTSWNQHRLRKLLEYVQARVLEMRQQQHLAQQFQAAAAAQYAQLHAAQALQFVPTQQQLDRPTYGLLPDPEQSTPASKLLPDSTEVPPAAPKRSARNLVSGRAVLGIYTRSKLPSFRRLQLGRNGFGTADNGGGSALGDYRMPYEYEG
jgi:hypothetical protein